MKIERLWVVVLAGIFCVACAKDRNPDDYAREQVEKQAAKIQAVSGTYTGQLVAAQNGVSGSASGAMTVVIQQELNSQGQASVKGQVTLVNSGAKLITFTDGTYNDSSGALNAQVEIILADQSKVELQLTGTIGNDQFSGQIEAEGYPEAAGTFQLSRSGPVVAGLPAGVISGSSTEPTSGISSVPYKGSMHYYDGTDETLSMFILSSEGTPNQEFLYSFLPVRLVNVTIQLQIGAQVSFSNAQWDLRTRRLSGVSSGLAPTVGGGGVDRYEVTLDCFQPNDAQSQGSWNCQYFSNQYGLMFSGVFAPVGAPVGSGS